MKKILVVSSDILLDEMGNLGNSLKKLSDDLFCIRQQLKDLKAGDCRIYLPTTLGYLKLKRKVKNIIKDLDRGILQLIKLDYKTKNLISLKERIEVLQEGQKIFVAPDYNVEFSKFKSDPPNSTHYHKIHLPERVQIFKRQYPENFWSAIIALFIFLVICYKATEASSMHSPNPKNTNQNINLFL